MLPKFFPTRDGKSPERGLLLMGLVGISICALLALGVLDEAAPEQPNPAAKTTAGIAPAETAAATQPLVEEKAPLGRRSGAKKKFSAPKGPEMGSVFRTLGGLGLVIALMFGCAFIGARFLKKLRMKPQGEKVLELVDAIPLGPKRQVFVISAYDRRIVVGACNEQMNVLAEFGPDEIEGPRVEGERTRFEERLEQGLEREQLNAGLEMRA